MSFLQSTPTHAHYLSLSWPQFLAAKADKLVAELEQVFVLDHLSVNASHRRAWKDEVTTLQKILKQFPFKAEARVLLEFPRPAQGARRVGDALLLLPSGSIAVLEFKGRPVDEYDQRHAIEDALHLQQCHSESHARTIKPFLVVTDAKVTAASLFPEALTVARAKDGYQPLIDYVQSQSANKRVAWDRWEKGSYGVVPSILRGTAEVIVQGKIPQISGEVGEHITEVSSYIEGLLTSLKQARVIVVVGAPGAGKTLLGVTLVAKVHDKTKAPHEHPILFSGNRPLIAVLREAISTVVSKSKGVPATIPVFIQDAVHVKQHLHQPSHLVRVFDEAQRAWVAHGKKTSELEQLWGWVKKDQRTLVLLVGKGQAIHTKEMTDAQFWKELHRLHTADPSLPLFMDEQAAADHGFLPSGPRTSSNLHVDRRLRLHNPIRQHGIEAFAHWVDALIEGDTTKAASLASRIRPHYPLLISQKVGELEKWAETKALRQWPKDRERFRYGWFESSKPDRGVGFHKKQFALKDMTRVAEWYIASPQDRKSCCQLTHSCTEFSCQGLEVDLALVAWHGDFHRRASKWSIPRRREHPDFTANVYRVLLTRGRQGLLVYCSDPETYRYLMDCGMRNV